MGLIPVSASDAVIANEVLNTTPDKHGKPYLSDSDYRNTNGGTDFTLDSVSAFARYSFDKRMQGLSGELEILKTYKQLHPDLSKLPKIDFKGGLDDIILDHEQPKVITPQELIRQLKDPNVEQRLHEIAKESFGQKGLSENLAEHKGVPSVNSKGVNPKTIG